MILSLEVFQAQEGDCLLLHYGSVQKPQLILIDGGPSGIYKAHLKPRLLAIRQKLTENEPLPLKMVMVSHADDDHINGIITMADDLLDQIDDQLIPVFGVENFWFNSFDDIIGNEQVLQAALEPSLVANSLEHIAATISSTGQGRRIRDKAEKLNWLVNAPFTPVTGSNVKLVRGDDENSNVVLAGLTIDVLHPDETRLKKLQKKWDEDLKKAKAKGDDSILTASLNDKDDSPFNLSSIVCLVKFEGKTILLTGDGLADDIYQGLERNGFLDEDGRIHVDILKMPHHGSQANMTPDFLRKVTADHYVISADGKHDNPDKNTLIMMAENIKKGNLYLTNHDDDSDLRAKLDDFIDQLPLQGSTMKVVFREPEKSSLVIDLIDFLPY